MQRSCSPGQSNLDARATGPASPQTLDEVYVCVRSALTHLAAGLSSAECTSVVADMVYSAVQRAVADFAAAWNDSAPATMSVLSNELLISSLSYLALRDKISASHVSRGWRRFMLAAPTLWDTVDTSQARCPCPIDVFGAMVARSGTTPLDVNLQSGWHPHTEVDSWPALLGQVSSRLRSLAISLPMPLYPDFDLFDNFNAPLLEVLRVDARQTLRALSFPSNGNTLMPRLKHLELDRVYLPEVFEPMPGLQTFEGHCYENSGMHNLFAIFPGLVSVTLHNLSTPVTLPGTVPPSTLTSATISVNFDDVETSVALLRTFTALPQCKVRLSVPSGPTPVIETVGALAGTHAGPWEFLFQSPFKDSAVTVERGGSDGSFVVALPPARLGFGDDVMHVGAETFALSPFDRLAALTLNNAGLSAAGLAGAQLPALRELCLVDESYGWDSIIRDATADLETAPLRLPALRALTLTLGVPWRHAPEECTTQHLHHFVAARLRCGAKLRQITVDHCAVMHNGAQCVALCFPELSKLAERVLSVTTAGGEESITADGPVVTAEMVDDIDMPPVFSLIDD